MHLGSLEPFALVVGRTVVMTVSSDPGPTLLIICILGFEPFVFNAVLM